MLRSCRAERRRGGNQPEPSERRAIMGLYKYTLFRCKASFKVCFSSGEEGVILCYRFFKASRLPLRPKKMRDERLLLSYNFFCRQSRFKPHFWTIRAPKKYRRTFWEEEAQRSKTCGGACTVAWQAQFVLTSYGLFSVQFFRQRRARKNQTTT